MKIGTIHMMKIVDEAKDLYLLQKNDDKVILPKQNSEQNLTVGESIDVFVYMKNDKLFATTTIPKLVVGTYGWVEVADVVPHLGVYVDIGLDENVLIHVDDLPAYKVAWPAAGDKLYALLKSDRKNRFFAVPGKESAFDDLYESAFEAELNDQVSGTIIRVAREGAVLISEENYRCFIHHTERDGEVRLGEHVTARVIEVKDDGSLNLSLLPLKHERIDDDAQIILQYLSDNDGIMDFSDKSDPEEIRKEFSMSKSAFKRALGNLMKLKKITQKDGKTFLQ